MINFSFSQSRFAAFKKRRRQEVEDAKGSMKAITAFVGFTSFAGLMTTGLYTGLKWGTTAAGLFGLSGGTMFAIAGGLIAAGVFCLVLALFYFKATKWLYKMFRRVVRGNETYDFLKGDCKEISHIEIDKMIKIVYQLKILHDNGLPFLNDPLVLNALSPVQQDHFKKIRRYFLNNNTTDAGLQKLLSSKSLHELRKERAAEMLDIRRARKAYALTLPVADSFRINLMTDGLNAGRGPLLQSIFHKILGWFKPAKSLLTKGQTKWTVPQIAAAAVAANRRTIEAPRSSKMLRQAPHRTDLDSQKLVYSLLRLSEADIDDYAKNYLANTENYMTQQHDDVLLEQQRLIVTHTNAIASGDNDTAAEAQKEINYINQKVLPEVQTWFSKVRTFTVLDESPVAATPATSSATPAATAVATVVTGAGASASAPTLFKTKVVNKPVSAMSQTELQAFKAYTEGVIAASSTSTARQRIANYDLVRITDILSKESEGTEQAFRC